MDLTEENIKKLKSLVRVSMDMHDYENWKNGEYFGDARKFWDGAMQGIDMWVDKMRESQKPDTSDEALPIADVVLSEAELLCSCGKPSDSPLCFDCFSKGLERDGAK